MRAWALMSHRSITALAALTALTVLAAGCGGSSTGRSTTAQPANSQMLAYSECMRSHGEPKFPDPNAQGQVKQQLASSGIDVSSPRYQAASKACQSKLPTGGSMTPAQFQQMKKEALRFSQCIRAHGFPNYPDPGSDGREVDPTSVGIDDRSPQYKAADKACMHP